jgi:hypothetical protein
MRSRPVVGRRWPTRHGGGGNQCKGSSNDGPSISQADAAKMLNIGKSSVERAKKVFDKGSKDLVDDDERSKTIVICH